jgi:hypothetical protein
MLSEPVTTVKKTGCEESQLTCIAVCDTIALHGGASAKSN